MTKTRNYRGIDPDGVAEAEADHFGNCPVCEAYIDMRDLGQVLAHRAASAQPTPFIRVDPVARHDFERVAANIFIDISARESAAISSLTSRSGSCRKRMLKEKQEAPFG